MTESLGQIHNAIVNSLLLANASEARKSLTRSSLLDIIRIKLGEPELPDRTMRDAISWGGLHGGLPMVLSRSNNGGGYYVSSDPKELRKNRAFLHRYAMQFHRRCQGIDRALRTAEQRDGGQQVLF